MSSAALPNRLKGRPIPFEQVLSGRVPDVFFGNQQNIQRIYQQILILSEQFPGPASDPVALNGISDLLAGDGGHPGMAQTVGKTDQIEESTSRATAFFVKISKIFFLADPLARTITLYHQTARRFRPFCLRLLMTFCPPLVLMRTRNP